MSAEELFEATREVALARFLSRRHRVAHLVAPTEVLQPLFDLAPDAHWTGSTTLDKVPKAKRRLYVYAPSGEGALIAQARSRFPQMQVQGVLHHVIPQLTCASADKPEALPPAADGPPARNYAVICTPRTGSTFFCDLLQAGGLGAPREHLRRPLVHALRAPGVDHEEVLSTLQAHGQRGSVFGTKLISHFLFDVVGPVGVGETLARLHARGFVFIRLVRDPIEQAVSKVAADQSRVWHLRGELTDKQRERTGAIAYDGPRLQAAYTALRVQERAIDEALAALPPQSVLTLAHADFTAQPQDALQRVAAWLDWPVQLDAVDGDRLPRRLSAQMPVMAEMAALLRVELAGSC
jgi:LPS sulfotransferase NodH